MSLYGFEPSGYSISMTETPSFSKSSSLYIFSFNRIIVDTRLYLKKGRKKLGFISHVDGELIAKILPGMIQLISPCSSLFNLKNSAVSNLLKLYQFLLIAFSIASKQSTMSRPQELCKFPA